MKDSAKEFTKRMTVKGILMIVAVVTCLTSIAWSQRQVVSSSGSGGWKKLGESTVFFYDSSESWTMFQVDSLPVDQAKLRILKSPLLLAKMLVFYSSGELRGFPIQSRVNPGMEAGPFLLDSGRLITSIALRYKTVFDYIDHQALIELYGRKITGRDSQVNIYKRSPK